MPKSRPHDSYSVPLDAALGTQAKVRVLRALIGSGRPWTRQELTRETRMTHRAIDLGMRDLVALGLVEHRGGAREKLFAFNPSHRLAGPLAAVFQVERDLWPSVRAELIAAARQLGGSVVSLSAVGGDVTRGAVHLVAVTRDVGSVHLVTDRIVAAGNGLNRRHGLRLRVTVYDVETARRMWGSRTPAAERAVSGATTVFGSPLDEVLGGGPHLG